MWQDWVLMLGSFVFTPSLVVSIVRKAKYPSLTTLPTAVTLVVFAFVNYTLHLYLASITTLLTAICWFILFLRRK